MTNRIKKNAKGYGYNYTDLAAVNQYIEELGEVYEQYTKTDEFDHNEYVWTKRIDAETGETIIDLRGAKVVQATLSNGKQNPAQAYGSSLTYARRYSLLMAYGLATTDDDAESLTIPDGYMQQPVTKRPSPYRDKLITLASESGIVLTDIQEQYGLVHNDTEEHYKAAYEQLKKDLGA